MRQLVAYDDIAAAPIPESEPSSSAAPQQGAVKSFGGKATKHQNYHHQNQGQNQSSNQNMGRSKKRKTESRYRGGGGGGGGSGSNTNGNGYDEEVEESRMLTQEEIWDDSALIDAWDAANQEYEAEHGKTWSEVQKIKSALWYNVPPDPYKTTETKTEEDDTQAAMGEDNAIGDSVPLDFETFVPSHDASLGGDGAPIVPHGVTVPPTHEVPEVVSAEEAFSRAMNSMYWTGYWTAMYHAQTRGVVDSEER